MFIAVFLYFLPLPPFPPLPPLPFHQAPFILFQGHAGGVLTPPFAPPQAPPLTSAPLVPERRSPGNSPVRSGGGGAHARAGAGWRWRGRAAGSRDGVVAEQAVAAWETETRDAPHADEPGGRVVVSVPGTQQARDHPLHGLRVPGPAAFSGLQSFPKPARGRRTEGLLSGGRAPLSGEGARGRRRGLCPAQAVPLGGGAGVFTYRPRRGFWGRGGRVALCPRRHPGHDWQVGEGRGSVPGGPGQPTAGGG